MRKHAEDPRIFSTKKQLEQHLDRANVLESSRPYLRALGNVGHNDRGPVKAPNQERDNSVAFTVEGSIQVANNQGDDGRIDIAVMPIDAALTYYDGTAADQETYVADANNFLIYQAGAPIWNRSQLITIARAGSGETPWGMDEDTYAGDYLGVSLLDGFTAGTSHIPKGCKANIVAMTVEVINTTAELYVSGQVQSYSSGGTELDATRQVMTFNDSTGVLNAVTPTQVYIAPAQTLEQVGLISDAARPASQGALMPVFSNRDNAYTYASMADYLYLVQDGNDKNYVGGVGYSAGASGASNKRTPTFITGVNTSVAVFSGLSSQTTLFVKYVIHVEMIVPSYNPLYPFATPMAPYDPRAIELVSEVYQDLLSSYPADWNGFGDFLKHVVGKIRDFVSKASPTVAKIAGALGEPEIALIAQKMGELAKRKKAAKK
jgi:hypothetical protein